MLQSEPQVWGRNLKINDLKIIHRALTCVEKRERKTERKKKGDILTCVAKKIYLDV
jgi:hypothetical protein